MWAVGLIVVALLIVWITHWVYKWKNPICKGKLPPGSMGLPIIGETLQFFETGKSLDIPPFVKKRLRKYGPIFKTSLVGRQVIISADAEFNHFIFQQEGKMVELWYMDSYSKIFEQANVITAPGQLHKYIRNTIQNHFATEKLKEKLLPEVEEISHRCLQFCTTQESVEMRDTLTTMIFHLGSKQLFGFESTVFLENTSEMFKNFTQTLMAFPLNIPGTAYNKCLKKKDAALKMMKDLFTARRASPEKVYNDFLDNLIKEMKTQPFLTEEFVPFLMFGMMVTTLETIAPTLALAVKFLTENPSVLQELKDEHEAILRNREDLNSGITWSEYKSMDFTNLVINETLRLANIAPGVLRKVVKDIQINGYTIPAGWAILVVPASIQLNPKAYKDPLAFNPWRWKDLDTTFISKNFMPFGGGMRACTGSDFSRVIMAVFLHVLVTNYRWTKIKGGEILRTPCLSFGKGYHIKVSEKQK